MEAGELDSNFRKELALKVFTRTSAYDGAIRSYLATQGNQMKWIWIPFLVFIRSTSRKIKYVCDMEESINKQPCTAVSSTILINYGKELNYNNIIDISAAAYLIGEFERPTVAILKHTNPCGVAIADNLAEAWESAYATDRRAHLVELL